MIVFVNHLPVLKGAQASNVFRAAFAIFRGVHFVVFHELIIKHLLFIVKREMKINWFSEDPGSDAVPFHGGRE